MTNVALVARKLALLEEHLRLARHVTCGSRATSQSNRTWICVPRAERLWNELPAGMASFGAFAASVSAFLTRVRA
jgi:hypothetical protein